MTKIVASGIENAEHLTVFDKLAEVRFAALEIEKVLVYIVQNVDVDALPFLAEQFDLLGNKGWRQAANEQERRDLIKRAIDLHRYKGTPYAVKQAILSLGYNDAILQENISNLYNGVIQHNGVHTYGSGTWATFRVTFDLGNDKGVSESATDELIALINEYKNVRSQLVGLNYKASVTDSYGDVSDSMIVTAQIVG